jgi:hypothetical protein
MAPITVTRLQRHVDLIIRSKASGGHLYTSVRRRLLQSRRGGGGGGGETANPLAHGCSATSADLARAATTNAAGDHFDTSFDLTAPSP